MKKVYIGTIAPFKIFWDTEVSQNRHVLVTGKSGSGKTTALLHLAHELLKSSGSVYFLDYTSGVVPLHGPLHTQDILQHPHIRDTFSLHNPEQDEVANLLRYADITANIWKLGVRQKSMVTNAMLRMNCLSLKQPDAKNPYAGYLTIRHNLLLYSVLRL